MNKSYVPLWEWLYDFRRQAEAAGDWERSRLVSVHHQAWEILEKNPEHALALYQQGAETARQLREPCVELFHEYWAAEMILFYLARYQEALDFTTKLVTKASQPQYKHCPICARVYITLIATYFNIDALGYEAEIQHMLEYMEEQLPLDDDTHQRLQGYRTRLWLELDDYPKAEEAGLKYLSMIVGNAYRETDAYGLLTHILYLHGRNDKAMDYAVLYEQKARVARKLSSQADSQLWQALFYRKNADEETAQQLFRRGLVQDSTLGVEKGGEYYDMRCRFYEAGQEYEKSLAMRDEQISKLANTTGQAVVFDAHRKRCLVLRHMGKLTPDDLEVARAATQQLKHPEKYLPKLDELEDESRQPSLY